MFVLLLISNINSLFTESLTPPLNESVCQFEVQFVPTPFYFCFFLPHPIYAHICPSTFCSHYLSSSMSMGPQLLPDSFTTDRAKASSVKFLKWHYSWQFFSLYLKCLNVWQESQSFDPAHTSCEKEVKDIDLYLLPAQQLENLPGMREQNERRGFVFVYNCYYLPSPVDRQAAVLVESIGAAITDLCMVTRSSALFTLHCKFLSCQNNHRVI